MPLFSRSSNTSDSLVSWRRPRAVKTIDQDEAQETTALPQLRGSTSSHSSSLYRLRTAVRIGDTSQHIFSSSPTSRAASIISSRASSKEAGSMLGHDSGRSWNLAQTLITRGKMLKHPRSKFTLTSVQAEPERTDLPSPTLGNCPNHCSSPAPCDCKYIPGHGYTSISAPFEFKHVTHSHPQHFRDLDRTNENDLVAEYSAVRAAQRSRPDLQGIKAEALHSRNSSADTSRLGTPSTSGGTSPHLSSVPSLISELSQDSLHALSMSSQPFRYQGRGGRSRESFSQPFVGSRIPKIGDGPLTPPPRISSKRAYTEDHRATKSKDSIISGQSDLSVTSTDSNKHGIQFSTPNISVQYIEPNSFVEKPLFLEAASIDVEPFSHAFSLNRLLSPVSEEDISAPVSRSSYTSVAVHDAFASEDTTASVPKRASTVRTSSQASVCTVVFAPNQNSMHTPERFENAIAPDNGPASRNSRRISMRRSSTTNGLFSSWEDDQEISRMKPTHAEHFENNEHSSEQEHMIVTFPDGRSLEKEQENLSTISKGLDVITTDSKVDHVASVLPAHPPHKRTKTNQKINIPVRTARRRHGPPSAPPTSTLPAPPSIAKPRSSGPNLPNLPTIESDASQRSKVLVKPSLPPRGELLATSSKSSRASVPANVSIYDAANKRDSHPKKKTPSRCKKQVHKSSLPSDMSFKRLPDLPKFGDLTFEPDPVLSVSRSSKRVYNGSSYTIFPPSTKHPRYAA